VRQQFDVLKPEVLEIGERSEGAGRPLMGPKTAGVP